MQVFRENDTARSELSTSNVPPAQFLQLKRLSTILHKQNKDAPFGKRPPMKNTALFFITTILALCRTDLAP